MKRIFLIILHPSQTECIWTNQDILLEVMAREELAALTVNGESILSEDNKFTGNKVITDMFERPDYIDVKHIF